MTSLFGKKSLVLLIGACGLLLSCSRGWHVTINGTANGLDFARAVAVDAAGDVMAAGFTQNTITGFDFTVVKLDGAGGAELWRQEINGTDNSGDSAMAVTVDGMGNVIAAGSTRNTGTGDDFTVVKFDGVGGAELWRQDINGTANGADGATAVTADAAGDVVAAGFTTNTEIYYDFTVVKFNGSSGDELWRYVIKSSFGAGGATAVTVNGEGDAVAAGVTRNIGTGAGFTVVKLDGKSGAELWRQGIKGTANSEDFARMVTVDSKGDVVAAGYITNTSTQDDFFVVKFDGVTGTEMWRQVINGTANARDRASTVAVDAKGDVVAAGYTVNTGTADDFTVVKLDGASGAELWRQVINGTANGADFVYAVTVDSEGDVVAAGVSTNVGTSQDFTVVKFDGKKGEELWRRVINGSANGVDAAFAVAVDAAGDVVAAGRTANTGTGDDFTVVKLRGIDGSDF